MWEQSFTTPGRPSEMMAIEVSTPHDPARFPTGASFRSANRTGIIAVTDVSDRASRRNTRDEAGNRQVKQNPYRTRGCGLDGSAARMKHSQGRGEPEYLYPFWETMASDTSCTRLS